jgi:thiamine pyrophosphokinase
VARRATDPQNLIWVMPAEVCALKPETIVVVAGGDPLGGPSHRLPEGATVIAADGGVDRALALGLHVDLAIGDFDSITPEGLAAVEVAGTSIETHPPEKDATDLELALDAAIALRPRRIIVVGSSGGRLDHVLGAVQLLGHARYAGVEIDALLGAANIHIVRDSRTMVGTPGELVSLVPLHGAAHGITTNGLVYPLAGETLEAGSSRGTSNVFEIETASVTLERGILAIVRPGRGEL